VHLNKGGKIQGEEKPALRGGGLQGKGKVVCLFQERIRRTLWERGGATATIGGLALD